LVTTSQLEQLIRGGETLRVEFKGEARRQLSDSEIYEAVVCLANTEGGVLFLGVEDDGRVTGARSRHVASTDPYKLQAAIFNNTEPPVNTRVSVHTVQGQPVVAIEVDAYPEICATKDGKTLRRVQGVRGPECLPFCPHQHQSRRSDLGLHDYSALVVEGAAWDDLDPLEFERVRQTIRRLGGDAALLALDERELAQAMRLVESKGGNLVPNVAGLLLLGREEAIRRSVPTHEVAFQVLDARGDVAVNDFFHGPLLKTLDAVEQRFAARNQEQEVQVELIRLPVPNYAPQAFREAVNNAVLHRDYTRRGATHVQWHSDHLFISNPGGFLEGITLDNLLVHERKPRNPRLTEAARRIGLVETTGRGIDKIYLGQVRYGRPLPDFTQSDREGVRLVLRGGAASLDFAAFVYEQDKGGEPLTLEELLALNHLQHERRIEAVAVGAMTQRGEAYARGVLERLVERGLVEPKGEKRGRVYHLSARLYRKLGKPAAYVRAHGFDPIRQEAMVMGFLKAHGRITRREAADLCGLTPWQARHLLRKLEGRKMIALKGERRGAYYELRQEKNGNEPR
jgi:ATP-dependent DNA helicase RecG